MGNDKEITILGRTVRWTEDGIEYEGDSKHRKELLKVWGFGGETNEAKDAGLKTKEEGDIESKQELDANMAKKFRGMAARFNFMGQDRSDLQFAAREVCREMARPTVGGMTRLKKMTRYLVGAESVVWKMGQWNMGDEPKIEVYVDSDLGQSGRQEVGQRRNGVGRKGWSKALEQDTSNSSPK